VKPVDGRLIVIAKSPVPGVSKTRLCPPCSPDQAAAVAEACLADTLRAVAAVPSTRPVLALEGTPGSWLPLGIDVVAQRGAGLDERLAAAFDDCGAPALLIGMDTPQVTPGLLAACLATLAGPGVGAVLGPAVDGGWWAIGLQSPDPAAFLGVPMSTPHTCRAQHGRLEDLGLAVTPLPALRDVDTWEDAVSVAAPPHTRFAAAVAAVQGELASGEGAMPSVAGGRAPR
jgi:glycosyltransferase A (GT-A) superfamily protein (DUF2064 family)